MSDNRQLEILNKAREIIASYPAVAREIAQILPNTAEILGCTVEDLRMQIIHQHVDKLSRMKGIDSFELLMRLGCENETEYQEMNEKHLRKVAENLGTTYEDMMSYQQKTLKIAESLKFSSK